VTITITVLPQESPSATYPRGFAYGVSADGSIAVGSYNNGSEDFPAYYADGTISALPLLSGDTSGAALACSDDGSIMVGYSLLATEDAFTQTAVYWESGSVHALDPASNDTGETAVCCSSDGTVIVGIGPSGHPYYWTSGVPTELTATLPGGSTIYPGGCSADGSIIVGAASDAAAGSRAAVWNSGTLTALPSNPDGVEADVAYGCSSDGSSIVVGVVSDMDFNNIPCVWISGTLTFLDMGGAAGGAAVGCSADGTVIGGWVYDGSFNQVACAWINGALSLLPQIPSAARIDNKATAVSDDGSTLVGRSVDADGNTRAVFWSLPTTADTAILSLTADDAAIASTATNAIAAALSLTADATISATATGAVAAALSKTATTSAITSTATSAIAAGLSETAADATITSAGGTAITTIISSPSALFEIKELDLSLVNDGEDFVLRRIISTSSPPNLDVTCRGCIRGYMPDELTVSVIQGDSKIIMSPTQITAASWPNPSSPVGDLDSRVPRKGDKAIVQGKTRNIEAAAPIYLANVLVRIELQVRG
jgi:uncharacterized membrane protein